MHRPYSHATPALTRGLVGRLRAEGDEREVAVREGCDVRRLDVSHLRGRVGVRVRVRLGGRGRGRSRSRSRGRVRGRGRGRGMG